MKRPNPSNLDPAWHRHTDADMLFHYTNWKGLVGILSSRSLWATDLRYLADSVEFEYGRRLAIEKLSEIWDRQADVAHIRELSAAIAVIERLKPRLFAASLAVGEDLWSAWTGHCKPRDGYAIGFRTDALQHIVGGRDCLLKCVVYSPVAQRACLDSAEDSAVRGCGECPDPAGFAKAYTESFLRLAPFLKTPDYFEEGEWRIVPNGAHTSVRYRQGRRSRIPYVPIDLSSIQWPLPIEVILVGPNPRRMFDQNAVKELCRSLGLEVPVRRSSIPLRAR